MDKISLVWPLILSGALAGLVNFFTNYVELSFAKKDDDAGLLYVKPNLKDIWWVALIGYIIVGIAGAWLTPVIDAVVDGLKGLEWDSNNNKPLNHNYIYILFGYGLVFGYSTTRLLVSIVDSILRRISKIENKLGRVEAIASEKQNNDEAFSLVPPLDDAQKIIDECEKQFEAHKNNCSGFVKAVAAKFSVKLTGQADDIVDQIGGEGWTKLKDGKAAKEKADAGWLVIGGLKSTDHSPPRSNGHVVVVVKGGLAHNKYPTGYWGSLNGNGEKNKTINYAWNTSDRDNVTYSGRAV